MSHALTPARIAQFIADGFIRVDHAFSPDIAAAARRILWRETGCDPDRPQTWDRPVVRLGHYTGGPFVAAADSPVLTAAFDQLVGPACWLPCRSMGTFPIRFPAPADPGDTGWHIDAGFGTEDPDFLSWRTNVFSRGRALLMLFLFSDVGPDDAPTRIRVGSHADIARLLGPAGEAGLTLRQLAANGFAETAHRVEIAATGPAGTVYLCHPFLVHAARRHRGTQPRFLAQPPLLPARPIDPFGPGPRWPVAQAIRQAVAPDAMSHGPGGRDGI